MCVGRTFPKNYTAVTARAVGLEASVLTSQAQVVPDFLTLTTRPLAT
jgi:hypothetical protein